MPSQAVSTYQNWN